MKTTILLTMTIAALLAGRVSASAGFGLDGFRAADIPAGTDMLKASAPQQPGDDLIGVDMTVRIPFKALKNGMQHMADATDFLNIIDPAAPVFTKSGEFMKISNIRVDCNGIIVTPVVTLKLYLEGRDRVAVRVQKVQVHASMKPDAANPTNFRPLGSRTPASAEPELNQEELMVKVMDVLIESAYAAINEDLRERKIPMKAEQIISVKYNKTDWTLRAKLSSKVVDYFVHPGIVGELHLTGVALGANGLVLTVQTAQ